MSLEAIHGLRIDQAARRLEIHPFEVIRVLVVSGGLPRDLTLGRDDVARVRSAGGIETWWDGDPVLDAGREGTQAFLRALVAQLLRHEVVDPRYTRADNLFRGLGGEAQTLLRRWVNALIRGDYLATRMSEHGLLVTARREVAADMRTFASFSAGPLATLAERM